MVQISALALLLHVFTDSASAVAVRPVLTRILSSNKQAPKVSSWINTLGVIRPPQPP